MGEAMQTLSYSGTFVYLHDNQLETLRIVHARDDNGRRERLISLNGEAREVIRNDETVTCIWPGSRSVNVSKARPRNPLPVDLSTEIGNLRDQYRLSFVGDERVAGMQARIVAIEPVERDNGLLLRSDMTDAGGNSVEQVMFTDLRIIDSMPEEFFKPVLNGSGYTWYRDEYVSLESAALDAADLRWRIEQLPPGFELTAYNRKSRDRDRAVPVEHLVFSDGLATLSVFIEPGGDAPNLTGESRMGAVNAFGRSYDDYHVTVVGEVPIETLRRVGDSVQQLR